MYSSLSALLLKPLLHTLEEVFLAVALYLLLGHDLIRVLLLDD